MANLPNKSKPKAASSKKKHAIKLANKASGKHAQPASGSGKPSSARKAGGDLSRKPPAGAGGGGGGAAGIDGAASRRPGNGKGKGKENAAAAAGRSGAKSAPAPAKKGSAKGKGVIMDKKGKKPLRQYVGLPNGDNAGADSGSSSDGEGSSGSGEEEEEEDGLDVGDMLDEQDKEDLAFLTRMKTKELAKSRAYLQQEHRLSKPAISAQSTSASDAQKARRAALPKLGPAKVAVNSDDEEDLDALEEDDFAKLGSEDEDWDSADDSLDDELSVMSGSGGGSEFDDSDLDDFSDQDDEDGDGPGDDAAEGAWGGIRDGDDDDDDSSAASSKTLQEEDENDEGLEDRYHSVNVKRAKRAELEEATRKRKRLPVFGAGSAASSSDEEEEQENVAAPRGAKKSRVRHDQVSSGSEDEDDVNAKRRAIAAASAPQLNPYGARFGRSSIGAILSIPSRAERLKAAKEELATLGRDVVAEPELGINLLRRILSLVESDFTTPTGESLVVDGVVRVWAMGTALAVFVDVLPGYRIRPLTEQERGQRTTQAVVQQREYEDALVSNYKRFITLLDGELRQSRRAHTSEDDEEEDASGASAAEMAEREGGVLESVAVRCLCELADKKNYFNFADQVLESVVRRAANKVYDEASQLCLKTLTSILSTDTVGSTSLSIVRLLSRITKARSYLVHPEVISVLLSLRIADLGGIRANRDRIDRSGVEKKHPLVNRFNKDKKGGKGKDGGAQQGYMNKKTRKVLKERKEIAAEIAEAESSVKEEERTHHSTEILKLLFALYFRILKLPLEGKGGKTSELLPAALEGLARFSQLVNIDFFRDLLGVIRDILRDAREMRIKLLAVLAALELLSGQGEALNIDLTAFITQLYGILVPLTIATDFEEAPRRSSVASTVQLPRRKSAYTTQSNSTLLFTILSRIFLTSRLPNPPLRSMAFSKRLLIAALHWPSKSALQALEFTAALIVKEPRLASMLNTEDRRRDGVYRYDIDDEALGNVDSTVWWELSGLERTHLDEEVRSQAARLARWTKEDS